MLTLKPNKLLLLTRCAGAVGLSSRVSHGSRIFKRGLNLINQCCMKHPVMFSITIATSKTLLADYLVQRVFENRPELDLRRMFAFGLFGFAYMGAFQFYLYSRFFPYMIAAANMGGKSKAVLSGFQVFLDHSFALGIYLPVFYSLQSCVYANKIDFETVENGLRTCAHNWMSDARNMTIIYVPAQYLNFRYVPMQWRVCYVAAISMCWCTLLSLLRGSRDAASLDDNLMSNLEMIQKPESEFTKHGVAITRWLTVHTEFGAMKIKVTGLAKPDAKHWGRDTEDELVMQYDPFDPFWDDTPICPGTPPKHRTKWTVVTSDFVGLMDCCFSGWVEEDEFSETVYTNQNHWIWDNQELSFTETKPQHVSKPNEKLNEPIKELEEEPLTRWTSVDTDIAGIMDLRFTGTQPDGRPRALGRDLEHLHTDDDEVAVEDGTMETISDYTVVLENPSGHDYKSRWTSVDTEFGGLMDLKVSGWVSLGDLCDGIKLESYEDFDKSWVKAVEKYAAKHGRESEAYWNLELEIGSTQVWNVLKKMKEEGCITLERLLKHLGDSLCSSLI